MAWKQLALLILSAVLCAARHLDTVMDCLDHYFCSQLSLPVSAVAGMQLDLLW